MIRKLWTDEKPKYSGHYWLKQDKLVEVVHIWRGRVNSIAGSEMRLVNVALKDLDGKWSAPIQFPSLHFANKHEAKLKELTLVIIDCLAALDVVMTEKESAERGSKVAKISNALNFANDAAMHITLGMSFEQMNILKKKRERLAKSR